MNGTHERRALLTSAAAALGIGCAGVIAAVVSSASVILLDGLFNFVFFAAALFTLKVADLLPRGDDEEFPLGYAFFEPFVNGLKGFLILGTSAWALIDAVYAILEGGRPIAAGAAVAYGAFATAAGWTMALVIGRSPARRRSPLVDADATSWTVNAVISSGVLVAFAGVWLIRGTRLGFIAPYVDPGMVVLVVLFSLSVPVRLAWRSLLELLNRTPSRELLESAKSTIRGCVADLPVRALYVRMIQPGRTRMVSAHVVLPEDCRLELRQLDAIRVRAQAALESGYRPVIADLLFTADPAWGAVSGQETAPERPQAAEEPRGPRDRTS